MAYFIDPATGDLVINGFEKGIGISPYSGLTDIKNINISSIPGEANINFSTSKISAPVVTAGTVTGVDSGTDTITYTGASGLENGMAVIFSGTVPAGITSGQVYWIANLGGGKFKVYSNISLASLVDITNNTTGATFAVISTVSGTPKYLTYDSVAKTYWMIDSTGDVWTNAATTTSGYWVFTGNRGGNGSKNGNGLVFYSTYDTSTQSYIGYIFAFRDGAIDYTKSANGVISWVYGWNPTDGTPNNTPTYLFTKNNTNNSHEAITGPDNHVYFCDGSNIKKFFQTSPTIVFDPTNPTTYTYNNFNLLPLNDTATCLSPLATNILIGALSNIVYQWDTTSNVVSNYIPVAEAYTKRIITINTTSYIFSGNKGIIYETNGSQATPFIKIPDHISNTVEPYFVWGGSTYQKNRIYFGVFATDNAGNNVDGYGGVWCIDLLTKSIYLSNELSYGVYNNGSYASAIISIPASTNNPLGVGLYIGWYSGTSISTYGIDQSNSTPYTGGQAYLISDMIPIGTLLKPTTPQQLEFKLAKPLLVGESIEIQVASNLGGNFTSVMAINGDGSLISGNSNSFPLQNLQWLLVKVILTGKSSNPSFNRLTEIRIIGSTKQITGMNSLQ